MGFRHIYAVRVNSKLSHFLKEDSPVVAAEAKRIAQRRIHAGLHRVGQYNVKRIGNGGVDGCRIDGRRNNAVTHTEQTCSSKTSMPPKL